MKMKPAQLLYIEWADHYSDCTPAWKSRKDAATLGVLLCSSVGWVVAEDKKSIRLAASVGNINAHEQNFDGLMTILKGCIVCKKVLNPKAK